MAQKAAKTLAHRNTTRLNRTHLTTLGVHALYLIARALRRSLLLRRSLVLYVLCSLPGLVIELWLERIGRPAFVASTTSYAGGNDYSSKDLRAGGPGKELKSTGEDLDAPGLTEFMWDVVYWTWGCIGMAAMLGDGAWSLWIVIPLYALYSAWTVYSGAKSGLGLGGAGLGQDAGQGQSSATSKRQQKLEKRGGQQRVQYRS